jgi:Secretion system C-terminal sorting domain/Pregnancy-associated plasma protein-A
MKTIKLLLIFLLYGCWFEGKAQLNCNTPQLTVAQKNSLSNALQGVTTTPPSNAIVINGITHVPIKPHIFGNTDGSGRLNLGVLNNGLATVNRDFLAQNLQFYFCGTQPNYVNNSSYYNLNADVNTGDDLTIGNQVNDAINVYFVNSIFRGSTNFGGFASYPSISPSSNQVFLINSALTDGSWQHEFGHYFSLYHTFDSSNNPTISERETVARTGVGANCSIKGDELCDTPADPYGRSGATYSGCTYAGTITDANGATYSPQTNNLMSYTFFGCSPQFTPNQYSRIGQGLSLRLSYASQSGGYNIEGCAATVLTAPSSLTVTVSGTTATISWTDNSTTEMGFIIERSTSSTTGFVAIGGVAPNATTFTDNTVVSGTSYFYRVKASNTTTNYSNIASTGGPCPATYNLTASINAGIQLFQASNSITSTSQISGSGTDVTYRAVNKIVLNQGFKVSTGAIFKGRLGACNSMRQSAETQTAFLVNEEIEGVELSAYPNPTSNGEVLIQYTLPEDGNASINLANMSGINVKNIVEDKFHEKGTYKIKATLSDLRTGVYLYILQGDKVRLAKKIVVE